MTHVGLITGGAAVALVDTVFLFGLAGNPFVGRFQTFLGENPFEPGLFSVPVSGVAAVAAALALLAFGLSYVLKDRLPC